MTLTTTADGLPTDDERPERRRRRALVLAGIGVTLVIAGLIVAFAKPNPKLHLAAPPPTSTTAPAGDYATEVAAANSSLTTLLGLGSGWDATTANLQKELGTVSSGSASALAALQSARAAHRQKPQNCPAVLASTGQVQSITSSVESTAESVSAGAGQVLGALTQSQSQFDQLGAQLTAAAGKATPAQTTGLQSLQLAAASLGARRTLVTQTATTIQGKADKAVAGAKTLSAQATTLAAGCHG